MASATQWTGHLVSLHRSIWQTHLRAALPLYWPAGRPAALVPVFLSQAGSFLQESVAVPRPTQELQSMWRPQPSPLPAFLLEEGSPMAPGDLAGFRFPFSQAWIAGRRAGVALPSPPMEHCLTALLSSSSQRFSEPPSGVVKSPPALCATPGRRAAQGCRAGRGPVGRVTSTLVVA